MIQFLVLIQVRLTSQISFLQKCDFIHAGPGPGWSRAGAKDSKSLMGFFGTVLGAQQPPVDEVDAILSLWGRWLCLESGMTLVESWPKVDSHYDTHCRQDKHGHNDSEQPQPVRLAQHLCELPLGLLPSRAV
ncbi:hypothetical protein H920_19256 [Fukomys damarensis]|uniref:Uncharacterized protein n=1 Tax=Fukomys damarensis TaxID=885580 RepID=A0A091CPZ5_FUKDA|nr:hypothetical protein H920_19256 [Fukomys damarensis]